MWSRSHTHVDNDYPHEPVYKMSTPLPGPIQTVPRSELTAVLITVQKIEVNGRNDFFTYSETTKYSFYKGHARARLVNTADLWNKLFEEIERKNIDRKLY